MTPRRSSVVFALSLVCVMGLAACSGGTELDTGADGSSTTAPPVGDADEVVVRVDVSGGFVPMDHAFRSVPSVTIYGNGLTITPGAVIAIYPGPALTPLAARTLTSRG